ncbi:MAG: periplasmic heavy metal sensor [Chitinophagales bacterium]|nr:periplasmic heavy metal sensor [Hyphomicrobiales bacterium]
MNLGLTSSGRMRSWALVASLCLNALLMAYLGTTWIERRRAYIVAPSPVRVIELLAKKLPARDRDLLLEVYRRKDARLADAEKRYQSALASMSDQLSLDELNEMNIASALSNLRDRRLAAGDVLIEILQETIPQLSPAGRQVLTQSLRYR